MQGEGGIVSIVYPKEINGTWQLVWKSQSSSCPDTKHKSQDFICHHIVGNCYKDFNVMSLTPVAGTIP